MLQDIWSFIKYIFTDPVGFSYFVLPVLLTFGVQLLLCFRTRRVFFKLAPLLLRPLVVGAVYFSIYVLGFGGSFIALFVVGSGLLILLGSVLAWALYGIIRGAKSMKGRERAHHSPFH